MSRGIRFVSGINEGLSIPIREGREITLGRNKTNDVVLSADSWVSGMHAAVKLQGNRLYLKDMRSTNGTFVASERIPPDSYRQVNQLFVVGSTIFEAATGTVNRGNAPMTVAAALRGGMHDKTLIEQMTALSQGAPILNSVHLFTALLACHEDAIRPFCLELNLDIDVARILSRYRRHILFREREAWLNRFLSLTDQGATMKEPHLTPLVASVLAMEASPLERLGQLLENGYSLVYPVLHHEATKPRWLDALDRLNAPVEDATAKVADSVPGYLKPLIAMDDFWSHLGEMLEASPTVLLTGDFGSGKSALMKLGLREGGRTVLPAALTGQRNYFDPKVFFQIPNSMMVTTYLDNMVTAIGQPDLTVIDHLDLLLETLAEQNLGDTKILEAISRNRFPLIIVASRHAADQLTHSLGNHQRLDLENYLKTVIGQCQDGLLEMFSQRLQIAANEATRKFFRTTVVPLDRFNLRAQKEYIDLCISRFETIDHSLARIADETVSIEGMGSAIFKEVYQHWLDRPLPEPPPEPSLVMELDPSSVASADAETLDRIEELIHNFTKHVFKTSLSYSDRTSKLRAEGRLERKEKLAEFQEHMVYLISTFQSAFPAWFEELWLRLDPEMIREDLGRPPVKKLWAEFEERARNIVTAYAEDLFHQTAARFFREALQNRGR